VASRASDWRMASSGPSDLADPTQLRGRAPPWGAWGWFALALLVVAALGLRLAGLAAEGFADDEVHKWLAAARYLHGDFGGDDVEHPMLMKSLVTLALAAFRGTLAPETLTRLPSAVAGALTVLAGALLGRRLFGRTAGLIGAALLAFAPTAVGYQRIAKEDTLLGLFFTLCLWCLAEARAAAEDGRAREQRRFEAWSAALLGAAFASKYVIFYFLIPLFCYAWLERVSAWRVPLRRWAVLVLLALAVFLALNWAPLLPGTADYMVRYIRGDVVGGDRGVSESILFMGKLYGNLALRGDATPWWFFGAFAAFKFAPVTALLGFGGLALALVRRAPAHRVLLPWLAIFLAFSLIAGGKYGRFFVSVMPAFLLLSAHAGAELARWTAARLATWRSPVRAGRWATAAVAVALVAPEAQAAIAHAPHHRLYLSPLVGGDRSVTWFLPHCDYFDAGVREAVEWVATHAEPGAEVASEVDWTVRLYAERAGRTDLASSPIVEGRGCRTGRPCYVLVQAGRLYRHNEAAVARLAARTPEFVARIGATSAVRVYRLEPGEPLFPPRGAAAATLGTPPPR
jgi:4-amino-4-deoxy-L-arabinose transferase-like glycosyltransferase